MYIIFANLPLKNGRAKAQKTGPEFPIAESKPLQVGPWNAETKQSNGPLILISSNTQKTRKSPLHGQSNWSFSYHQSEV